MTTLALSSADLTSLPTDALVVATAPAGGRKKAAVLAGPATSFKAVPTRRLEEALAALGATGKAGEIVRVPGAGIAAAPVVVAVGLGAGPWSEESLRRAAGTAVRALAGTRRVALALPTASAAELDAVAQGVLLGTYAFDAYRVDSKSAHKTPVALGDAARRRTRRTPTRSPRSPAPRPSPARSTSPATWSTPPRSTCPPRRWRRPRSTRWPACRSRSRSSTRTALAAGGYGGILGVGRGSENPPRLARLAYRPEGAERAPRARRQGHHLRHRRHLDQAGARACTR